VGERDDSSLLASRTSFVNRHDCKFARLEALRGESAERASSGGVETILREGRTFRPVCLPEVRIFVRDVSHIEVGVEAAVTFLEGNRAALRSGDRTYGESLKRLESNSGAQVGHSES
jgi:hypothetical protein